MAVSVEELELEVDGGVWERQEGESTKDYAAFRIYRDLPPLQRKLSTVAQRAEISERQARQLANEWNWRGRVEEWDDLVHQTEDRERLEAIRQMHQLHRAAGRSVMNKALQALQMLQPEQMSPGTIARMIQLGATLERDTLVTSVEELQGLEDEDDVVEDAWERIARELDPSNAQNAEPSND